VAIELIRELYGYHQWANRRLFDVTAALGEAVAGSGVGRQFSAPTLREMLVHIWESDWWWLETWKGNKPSITAGVEMGAGIRTLTELRARWDEFEPDQRAFIDQVREADLARVIEGQRDGVTFHRPFGMLLHHVANHATHHRSEIATMLTMVSGSPPDTGVNSYYLSKVGRPLA
jgi:uncharacterized damage-inducible protein DinB